MFFQYGETELNYLKQQDKELGAVIERAGKIDREVEEDLFSAVVHQIVGQQISMKAQETIWKRMKEGLGEIRADTITEVTVEELQAFGISFRKAGYIMEFSEKVNARTFDLEGLWQMSDADAIKMLSSLKGVGVWTAEMILLFGMQRPDILSYDDMAIRRGICMLHHHSEMDRTLFETYRKKYSPYGSVASFYLWAIANQTVECIYP